MKIQISIYEYTGEFYKPLKGCVYASFYTDSEYDKDEAKVLLMHMTLDYKILAEIFKAQGVQCGKVCIEYELTDIGMYIDGDEMYVIYDGENVELDKDEI